MKEQFGNLKIGRCVRVAPTISQDGEENMAKAIDYVIGTIKNLEHDRCAGWDAFYAADYRLDKYREEIVRLKKIIRELRGKKK
jgi:hypothetical protein